MMHPSSKSEPINQSVGGWVGDFVLPQIIQRSTTTDAAAAAGCCACSARIDQMQSVGPVRKYDDRSH